MTRITRWAIVAGALTTALALAGGAHAAAQDASDTSAWLRLLHASPDAPALDVYADGELVVKGIGFGVITEYREVAAGSELAIQVTATGADPAEGTLVETTLSLEPDALTTLAASNSLAELEVQAIRDAQAPTADAAYLRVVHLDADAPAVDVTFDSGDVLVSDLAYPRAAEYLALPAAEYDLVLRPADTQDVVLDLDPLTLEAGTSSSAFAIRSATDEGLRVLVAADALPPEALLETALLRVLHASPDAPSVDVRVDGETVLEDVSFGTLSEYLEVRAGTAIDVRMLPAGADPAGDALAATSLTLTPDTYTTLAAAGGLEAIDVEVIADAAGVEREPADAAWLRFVHLGADAPPLDLVPDRRKATPLRDEKPIMEGLRYLEASGYAEVPAGEYDLEARRAGKERVVSDLEPFTLEPGTIATAYLIGSTDDETLGLVTAVDAGGE